MQKDSINNPLLLIITGLPGTGKTQIGKYLSGYLGLPFLHKDGIKETLFDSLGWQDREWSRRMGGAAYDLLYYLLDSLMQAGVSIVVESNFHAERAGPILGKLIDANGYKVVQLLCKAKGDVLVERFFLRAGSGERHPGHVDLTNLEEMEPQLRAGRIDPLPFDGPLIEIDTTDFDMVDYQEVLNNILKAIDKS